MIRSLVDKYGPWVAALVFVASIFVMGAVIVYGYHQQHAVDGKLCRAQVANRASVRLTWNAARDLVVAAQTTEEARRRTTEFFDDILLKVPALRCEGSTPIKKEE